MPATVKVFDNATTPTRVLVLWPTKDRVPVSPSVVPNDFVARRICHQPGQRDLARARRAHRTADSEHRGHGGR